MQTGLTALSIIAVHHQIAADPAQLLRALRLGPNSAIGTTDILLAAKELGLAAKLHNVRADRCKQRQSYSKIATQLTGGPLL